MLESHFQQRIHPSLRTQNKIQRPYLGVNKAIIMKFYWVKLLQLEHLQRRSQKYGWQGCRQVLPIFRVQCSTPALPMPRPQIFANFNEIHKKPLISLDYSKFG
jgi:hypothetical protein